MTLRRWENVHAHAENGGYDKAKLHDTSGNDVVVAGPDWGSLSVDVGGHLDLLYHAIGFELVKAYHTAGNDSAPDPESVDRLMLEGKWNR
jgi:hypothetical protein